MSVFLSPLGNGQVFLTAAGLPAAFGLINTYAAGTTTPQATFTTSAGNIANAQPIQLTAAGMAPFEIWLTAGIAYKFVVTDSSLNQIGPTYDNLTGIGDSLYIATGTGTVTTTVQAKLNQIVSVFDFMTAAQINDVVTNTASVDTTAAFQNAVNRATLVFVPAGTYLLTGTVTLSSASILMGYGWSTTILKTNSATANVIVFNVAGCGLEKIQFQTSVTRTAGAYLQFTSLCSSSYAKDFYMLAGFYGVQSAGLQLDFENGVIKNTAANGSAMQFQTGTNVVNLHSLTITADANDSTRSGIEIQGGGALNMTDIEVIRHGKCLNIDPTGSAVVTSVYASNSYFDTGSYGVYINPGASATIQDVSLTGCWVSNMSNNGIFIGSVNNTFGVHITKIRCYSNTGDGVQINGGNQIYFLGGTIAGNGGNGVNVASGVQFWGFLGVRIGSGDGKPVNSLWGINIQTSASTAFFHIGFCDLTGNTSGTLNDLSTGSGKMIAYNNPLDWGTNTTITVGASPFLYTAGDRPETVYIAGGVVSGCVINGITVSANTNFSCRLGPGQSVQVTYTGIPTMSKTAD